MEVDPALSRPLDRKAKVKHGPGVMSVGTVESALGRSRGRWAQHTGYRFLGYLARAKGAENPSFAKPAVFGFSYTTLDVLLVGPTAVPRLCSQGLLSLSLI